MMVITRMDWRLNGDLLQWLATEYPGLPPAHFEAAYRLLAHPDLTNEAEDAALALIEGAWHATSATTVPSAGKDGPGTTDDPSEATGGNVGGHASVDLEQGGETHDGSNR